MKIRHILAACLIATGITVSTPSVASADINQCRGTFTMGIGGFAVTGLSTAQDSRYIPSDQPVGYDSLNIEAGVIELNRLFRLHRAVCPGDHIKILGHSGGAVVAHVWVTRNQNEPNATAILIADAKRVAGPGGDGIAGNPLAVPADMLGIFRGASGTDANFGSFPVLNICNAGDWVCNEDAGMHGYLHTGVHGKYNVNPHAYPNFVRGNWFPSIY